MDRNVLIFLMITVPFCVKPQSIDPYEYFPYSVGNRWEYSVQGGGILIYEIYKDSVDADGSTLLYYSVYYSNNSPNYGADPYFRIDTSYNVFIFPMLPHVNELWYKLDADGGDSWWVKKPDSLRSGEKAFVTNIYDSYIFGQSRRIKRIEYWEVPWYDTNETSWLITTREIASGIGKIFEDHDAVQPDFLVGAVIDGDTLGRITSVESESDIFLPSDIVLYQNYPNPFNPATTITYSLPEKGLTILKIYDILGKEVAELVNEFREAGIHTVLFEGNNIASGTYIVTLQSGEFRQSRKILLMK